MSDTFDYDDFHSTDDRERRVQIIDTSNLTIAQYQETATRTLLEVPEKPVEDREIMIIWNALGLVGKVGEIAVLVLDSPHNVDEIADELGDVVWYISAAATKLNMSLTRIVGQAGLTPFLYTTTEIMALRLCHHAGQVAELCKKGIFHRHGLDFQKIEQELINCMTFICGLATEYGLPLRGKIMAGNLQKLDIRYEKNFTSGESRGRIEYTIKETGGS